MSEDAYPCEPDILVSTLVEVFRNQKRLDIVELLSAAQPTIGDKTYDNWNGGTFYYTLLLEVPIDAFSKVEPRLDDTEQLILAKIDSLQRDVGDQFISRVTIRPILGLASGEPRMTLPEKAADHLWSTEGLRVFLSHISRYKTQVSALKEAMAVYGLSCFVAHEDIEPSREWHKEIELALDSMHVLLALLTDGFHESNWVDQEIGYALGRKVPVIPVRLPLNPYGLMGKLQGMSGSLEQHADISSGIMNMLLKKPTTTQLAKESLVVGLERAYSFEASKIVSKVIVGQTGYTDTQLDRLVKACDTNFQVYQSFGVKDRIVGYIRSIRGSEYDDDELPF